MRPPNYSTGGVFGVLGLVTGFVGAVTGFVGAVAALVAAFAGFVTGVVAGFVEVAAVAGVAADPASAFGADLARVGVGLVTPVLAVAAGAGVGAAAVAAGVAAAGVLAAGVGPSLGGGVVP